MEKNQKKKTRAKSLVESILSGFSKATYRIKTSIVRSHKNGLLPLIGFGIVLALNTLFYQWPDGDTIYIIIEYALFVLVVLSQYWNPKKNRVALFLGTVLLTCAISLDMIFYILIVLNEGWTDIIGSAIFVIDFVSLASLVYWLFIYRL